MAAYLILFITYIIALIVLSYGFLWPFLIIFLSGYVMAGIVDLAHYMKGRNANKN